MLKNCYVDNILFTAETVSEALQKYRESKQICSDAKMNLREFVSNSTQFNESIPIEDRADTGNLKNLGIPWQCIEDEWVISLHPKDVHPSLIGGEKSADQPRRLRDQRGPPLTRRKMLRYIMEIYDPCGLISPVLVAAKLAIQKVWEGASKLSWDQAVPEALEEEWNAAIAAFSTTEIRIPRRVCDGPITEARIHVFCDASADARNNVKPLGQANSLTIPRMEMMGLVRGSANIPFIVEEIGFPVQGIYLWSDSMIALHQILTPEKAQEIWLENRLKVIRQICREHNVTVGHVRTDDNPADHTSRGLLATELQNCNLWWHGPNWLRKDPSAFPEQPETIRAATIKWLEQAEEAAEASIDDPAINSAVNTAKVAANAAQINAPPKNAIACFGLIARINPASAIAEIPPENLLPEEQMARCRSWQKLRRVHATVFRACAIFLRSGISAAEPRTANYLGADLRDHFRETYSKRSKCEHFTVPELGLVESFLVRKAQAQDPPTAYDRKLLDIFLEGNFLRVRGRIAASDLPGPSGTSTAGGKSQALAPI
ncbi:Pao retrotransposon peptidase family protein [Aphelenchoides avenae]|nr:Pao retrotransposon peptidase family protein [Aphelenchus avenae]